MHLWHWTGGLPPVKGPAAEVAGPLDLGCGLASADFAPPQFLLPLLPFLLFLLNWALFKILLIESS